MIINDNGDGDDEAQSRIHTQNLFQNDAKVIHNSPPIFVKSLKYVGGEMNVF